MPRRPKITRFLTNNLFDKTVNDQSRRDFLGKSAKLSLIGMTGLWQFGCNHKTAPSIGIVGAGMAGLTAAYYLEKSGLEATIFESDSRVGGRILSKKNWLAENITTELGGEFIDSNHRDILDFCHEFDLTLLDMQADDESKLVGTSFFFGGKRITEHEITAAFNPFSKRMQTDIDSLTDFKRTNPKVRELDRLSIDEYLTKIGVSGWLFDILTTSFTSELGIQSSEQSCINLLSVLNTNTSKGFQIYGESDERYKISGGNEQLIQELQGHLKSNILSGHHLERIEQKGAAYQLSFANGKQVMMDYLIVTLPFSVLRNVDLRIAMSAEKRKCINELGYGTQSKMFIGVRERVWREQGYSGYVLSDSIHNGWDSSQMQNGNKGEGVYSLFLGSSKGANLDIGQYQQYLDSCDTIFPSMSQLANGKKQIINWNQNKRTKGAYACYKVGQITAFGGQEGKRIGNMLFAGEHCSQQFQGFMNGAAETGRQAAGVIVKALLK